MAVAVKGLVEASRCCDVMLAYAGVLFQRSPWTEGKPRRKGPVARRLVLEQRSSHVGLCVGGLKGCIRHDACNELSQEMGSEASSTK